VHKIPLCMVVDLNCTNRVAGTGVLSTHGHIRQRQFS
jgi:hypothetical protein